MLSFYRQHCAKRMQRYSSARGDFEVFRPAEATRCTDGADIRLVCRLIHAKYHRNRCRGGMLAPEVKILTSFFTRFRNINAPHLRILCAIFTKFSWFVGSFVLLDHALKLREIRLRGSGVTGVLS